DEPGDRAEHDHATALALREQLPDPLLARPPDAVLVHSDRPLVLFPRLVDDVVDGGVDARVRDHDVEAAERLDARLDGGPRLLTARDVAAHEPRPAPGGLDRLVRRRALVEAVR